MIVRHLPIERLSPDDGKHYWIGYYDKQPWSTHGDRVLAHRAPFCDRFPRAGESCEIGTIRAGDFEPAATTRAWNWQQGTHLRWHGDRGEEALLFNDIDDDGRPIARWVTPDGRERRSIPTPLYSVTPDGSVGLTLSFGRLTHLRPEYGYPAITDTHADQPAPSDDGIWRVNLCNGEKIMLCSIADLARISPGAIDLFATDAPHQHVNHIMVNPSGTRCCFMHRYQRDDGILQSRLFTIGLDGSGLRLLMEGMVSHYDWRDDGHITAWGGKRRFLGGGSDAGGLKPRVMNIARRTLKPMYYAMGKPRFLMNRIVGDSYLDIPDRTGFEPEVFAKGELTCDGHNTFLRRPGAATRWMLTDGYPDLKSRQPLYCWDLNADAGYEIGRYDTPRQLDGDIRVDLHPRFSRDGSAACIDSAMEGGRAIYRVDLSDLISLAEPPQ